MRRAGLCLLVGLLLAVAGIALPSAAAAERPCPSLVEAVECIDRQQPLDAASAFVLPLADDGLTDVDIVPAGRHHRSVTGRAPPVPHVIYAYDTATKLADPAEQLGLAQRAFAGLGGGFVAPNGTGFLDDATAPVGRRGNPIDIAPGTNSRATIGGREYSGHALDRMQGQGITPSVVDDALTTSNSVTGKVPGTTAYYDAVNDLTVITDTASGRVVTVDYGRIRQ